MKPRQCRPAADVAGEAGSENGRCRTAGPKVQTAFYRADAKPAAMPRVLLSKGDEAACKVKVGDAMPAIELPKLGGTSKTKLADLLGKKATVVVFWKGDRRMSQQQLADIGPDVVEPFGKQGVAVVGVAVDESAKDAEATVQETGATFHESARRRRQSLRTSRQRPISANVCARPQRQDRVVRHRILTGHAPRAASSTSRDRRATSSSYDRRKSRRWKKPKSPSSASAPSGKAWPSCCSTTATARPGTPAARCGSKRPSSTI